LPSHEALREAVLHVIRAGYQLRPDALSALREMPDELDPLEVVKKALEKAGEEGEAFIGREAVEEAINALKRPAEQACALVDQRVDLLTGKGVRKLVAKEIEADVKVLMDPTKEIGSEGGLGDFLNYFKDRFARLSKLLKRRIDARDALSVSEALRARPNSEVKMIGMVREKREGEGKIIAILEDENATATVIFTPKAGREAYEKARVLMPDQVICVRAVRVAKDLFAAKELVAPDLPVRKTGERELAGGPVYALFISDLHFGSRAFMAEAFGRLIAWLNGRLGNGRLRELAGAVKYVVIAGDLVDGIGVYPGQERELEVADIYRQYEGVATLLSELPGHVELIISPGNHDACRRALPQPAVPKDYAGPLYEDGRTLMLGNPCLIALHGVKVLVYHGNSFDDLATTVPGMGFDRPLEMMKLMLWARHLAPIYGLKTALAPTARDLLVVEEVPDIFHTGHIHVTAIGAYRGVLLVNSGAWQEQTAYQRVRGIVPKPGRAVLVDLAGLKAVELNFTRPELWS